MASSGHGNFFLNRQKLKKATTCVTEPKDIGEYSYEEGSGFQDTDCRKRFYQEPPNTDNVRFDLYAGHESFVRREKDRKKFFGNILRWVLNHHTELVDKDENGKVDRLPADFICRRGLLTDILTLPYNDKTGLKVLVSKFRGTHYLLGVNSLEEEAEIPARNDHRAELNKRLYGGSKFPFYMLANSPEDQPDPSQPVDQLSGYYRVFTRRVGPFRLLYSGEVDGVDETAPEGEQYVEFKTTVDKPQRFPTVSTFPFIKWWAQASSVGIRRIVVGLHGNPMGLVRRLKIYDVAEIPKQNYRYPWQPQVCYNFLDQFLMEVKSTVANDDPKDVYLFEKTAGDNLITCTPAEADSPHAFLPDWYVDWEGWRKSDDETPAGAS